MSPWPPEHKGVDVFHRHLELHCNKCAEPGGVQHAGHSNNALPWKPADAIRSLDHRVQRIAHDDDDGVWRVLHDLLGHALDDVVVRAQQVVAAHAGLAGNTGGYHDDVGIRRVRICRLFPSVGSHNLLLVRTRQDPMPCPGALPRRYRPGRRPQVRLSTIRCAAVAPTFPAPTTVTFLLAITCSPQLLWQIRMS